MNNETCQYIVSPKLMFSHINTLGPRQNGHHLTDDTFKRIFLNENVRISIQISLEFVPESQINNIPALVQIMACRLVGAKPLSEPMMVRLLTHMCVTRPQWVNGISVPRYLQPHWWPSAYNFRSRQDGRHFADDIFKCIFLNENVGIPIKISLKFVPKGPINNIPAMVQIMAWRRPGDKPLSEPMVFSLATHICVARPQWVNVKKTSDILPRVQSLYGRII